MTNRQIALIAAALVAAGRNQFESKDSDIDVMQRAHRFFAWLNAGPKKKAKAKR